MGDWERRTASLLRKHGVSAPPVPVEEIAQAEGLAVRYHDLEDEVSGMLIRQSGDQPVMAVNVRHHENRQRFTIAHELAHFLLHEDQPTVFVDDLLVHFRADAGSRTYDPRETDANAFAASLLMPKPFLASDLKHQSVDASDERAVALLARRYKVSAQALTIRLVNLGFVGAF